MQMPSLFKYFAFVGAALLALVTLANFLLDPSTGATTVATPAKPVIVVQHDPRASKVERWRNEQAALKAAAQTQTSTNASLVTKSELAPASAEVAGVIQPVQPAPAQPAPAQPAQAQPAQAQPAQAQPVQAQPTLAEPALQTADVSAEHDAQAARAKAERIKAAKAAKAARQAKLARERARADQLAQSQQNPWQQGQTGFFGGVQQRTASSQQASATNAYAPRPTFGPFGSFGRGW